MTWLTLHFKNAKPHLIRVTTTPRDALVKTAVIKDIDDRDMGPVLDVSSADVAVIDVGGTITTDASWATVEMLDGRKITIRHMHVASVLRTLKTMEQRPAGYYKIHNELTCLILSNADREFLIQEFETYPIKDRAEIESREFDRRLMVLSNRGPSPECN